MSLDEVSLAIGKLQGAVEGLTNTVKGMASDVSDTKEAVHKICNEGCPRGKSNGHRINELERAMKEAPVIPMHKKEWGVVSGVTTGISAVVVAIWRAIEWAITHNQVK